ncbi:copper homeostasis protein CutC [Sphingomonas silueang]|uniref:copper homeostasis protein CutC n=1 Tax=Sphingomonas silueang TaxID=3156617 RepID=UPI0032B3A203
MATILEICVDTLGGCEAAIAGGARRIELCSALSVGGLTPSSGLTREVVARAHAAGVRVHAMVRPRAGDFAYGAADVAMAHAESAALIADGIDGLVFGAVRDSALDHEVLRDWTAAMRWQRQDIDLTLHRAVDLLDDPVAAVEPAIALGFDRILTSGGAVRAADGAGVIAAMVRAAAGRIAVMPGSGVRPANAARLLATTGAQEIHASASVPVATAGGRVRALGFDGPARGETDRATVRALAEAVTRYDRGEGA